MNYQYYITELFVFVDDFFKALQKSKHWNRLKYLWDNRRGFKKRLSLSEVVTLNIIRYFMRTRDLKTFHRIAKVFMVKYFAGIPNYENFQKATNRSLPFILLFFRYLLEQNVKSNTLFLIDSTDLSVCENHNIYTHKVFKGLAGRGRTTTRWFYGFKLHSITDEGGNIVNVFLTPGNVHDNVVLKSLLRDIKGIFVADSGFLINQKELLAFFKKHQLLYIAPRKNMKKIMTKKQYEMMKKRTRIETVWDVLKERYGLVFHLARSFTGLLRHYIYSLISYILQKNRCDNPLLLNEI